MVAVSATVTDETSQCSVVGPIGLCWFLPALFDTAENRCSPSRFVVLACFTMRGGTVVFKAQGATSSQHGSSCR